MVVFITLFVLAEIIGFLARVLPKPQKKPEMEGSSYLESVTSNIFLSNDLPIIAAVMKKRGQTGALHIKRIY